MKYKNLLFGIGIVLLLVMTMTLVSATKDANFDAYYATIEDDGTRDETNTQVSGFSSVGYTCLDAACTLAGAQVPSLTSSTSTNTITVTFPTTLQSNYGYVLYFYKEGYIGWEQRGVIKYGTGPTEQGPDIYLSRKENGWAPIMNLNVDQEIPSGRPIEIDASVAIDADTYAALERTAVSDIPLNSLEEVETDVSVEITNLQGNIVYFSETQTLSIPVSQSVPVSFVYADGLPGERDYIVTLTTNVEDEPKILNSVDQEAVSQFVVIEPGLTDYSYSDVDSLEINPEMPDEGEVVTFSFDHASYYINPSGASSNVNSNIEVTIYRNSREIENFVDSNEPAGTYSFTRTYNEDGSYRIEVEANPEQGDLPTISTRAIGNTEEITFIVGSPGREISDDDDDDDDEYDPDEELRLLLAAKDEGDDLGTLDLRPDRLTLLEKFKIFLWTLFWLILLLIILIILVLIFKSNQDNEDQEDFEEPEEE